MSSTLLFLVIRSPEIRMPGILQSTKSGHFEKLNRCLYYHTLRYTYIASHKGYFSLFWIRKLHCTELWVRIDLGDTRKTYVLCGSHICVHTAVECYTHLFSNWYKVVEVECFEGASCTVGSHPMHWCIHHLHIGSSILLSSIAQLLYF